MISRYQKLINEMPWAAAQMLRSHFRLPPVRGRAGLFRALQDAHLTQADVVMALLRDGRPAMLELAEQVAGVRIQRLKSSVPPGVPAPVRLRPREGDDRRITWVSPDLAGSGEVPLQRLGSQLRAGQTIAQFLGRGGSRRDLRQALQRGLVTVENDDHPVVNHSVDPAVRR